LLGFSLVSGKQAKYLVPFLPAFALLAGRALTQLRGPARGWEFLPPALGFLAFPGVLLWLRARPDSMKLPEWAGEVPLWPLLLLALVAPALLCFGRSETRTQLRALAFAVLFAVAMLGAGVIPAFAPYSDPVPAARYLADLQAQQLPLAHLGKYHATYNFAGRLRTPIEILDAPEVKGWVAAHPQGRVLMVERSRYPEGKAAGGKPGPEYQAPFRGAWLQSWRGEALLVARPELR